VSLVVSSFRYYQKARFKIFFTKQFTSILAHQLIEAFLCAKDVLDSNALETEIDEVVLFVDFKAIFLTNFKNRIAYILVEFILPREDDPESFKFNNRQIQIG